MRMCICMCMCTCMCMYAYMLISVHIYIYVCMCICLCSKLYVCMYVRTYVCMYVCMHVRVYVCTHTYIGIPIDRLTRLCLQYNSYNTLRCIPLHCNRSHNHITIQYGHDTIHALQYNTQHVQPPCSPTWHNQIMQCNTFIYCGFSWTRQ